MKTYNEIHDFTHRNPTYLTKKQLERDSKIVKQIITAHDVECDNEKMLEIFFKKCHLLSNPRFWEIMRTVWCAAGNHSNVERFKQLMSSNRPAKSWFMTIEDKVTYESLIYPILLYRAYDARYKDKGISWTSNFDWAMQYAVDNGLTLKRQLFRKEEIFAYISRRGEDEFIIL